MAFHLSLTMPIPITLTQKVRASSYCSQTVKDLDDKWAQGHACTYGVTSHKLPQKQLLYSVPHACPLSVSWHGQYPLPSWPMLMLILDDGHCNCWASSLSKLPPHLVVTPWHCMHMLPQKQSTMIPIPYDPTTHKMPFDDTVSKLQTLHAFCTNLP